MPPSVRLNTKIVIRQSRVGQIAQALEALADRRVMVGFPRETKEREPGKPLTNAEIGYVHNYGAPEAHIPQREFMQPGLHSVQGEIVDGLRMAAQAALNSGASTRYASATETLDKYLHRIGLIAQAALKAQIKTNIPPPLAEATVRQRIARRKNGKWRQIRTAQVDANIAAGLAPQTGLFTALIDTGAMINALTYVIRRKSNNEDVAVGPTPGRKAP